MGGVMVQLSGHRGREATVIRTHSLPVVSSTCVEVLLDALNFDHMKYIEMRTNAVVRKDNVT